MTRHRALRAIAAAVSLAAALTAAPAAQAATYAYVSNADSGTISVLRLDTGTGAVTPVDTVPVNGTVMPMTLSPDHLRLYAGVRSQPYRVLSFAVNPLDGHLAELGQAPLANSMPFLSTDLTGRWLFSASYDGALLAVNAIGADGVAGAVRQTIPTGPKAHAILPAPDNRTVFASVLGADAWLKLGFDAGTGELTLDPKPAYALPPKSGPRHFRFSPDQRFIYLIDELDGKLHVLAFDREHDRVKPVQTVSIVPPGFGNATPWGADLHLTPDGRFLYASERTSSTLATWRVDRATGHLTRIATTPTEKQPRGFAIDPSGRYLLAVGQLSTSLRTYRIDARNGALTPLGETPVGKGANWVEIVDFGGSNAD
ncbi:lactonase family protein [Burkholderia sp. Ac-20379]|uniref:lactonase family protein n=1 Tax=Burkholderia sp. Ac-20379 TaxID=2703900 RepID=UPI0019805D00|nr:lactonase family protein [Burkholderia sp. Ac-20379]MBN3724733.1 lactonase family protein [Burkholderia sp. Ac-20379]